MLGEQGPLEAVSPTTLLPFLAEPEYNPTGMMMNVRHQEILGCRLLHALHRNKACIYPKTLRYDDSKCAGFSIARIKRGAESVSEPQCPKLLPERSFVGTPLQSATCLTPLTKKSSWSTEPGYACDSLASCSSSFSCISTSSPMASTLCVI